MKPMMKMHLIAALAGLAAAGAMPADRRTEKVKRMPEETQTRIKAANNKREKKAAKRARIAARNATQPNTKLRGPNGSQEKQR